jgi:hypothetical protein
VLLDVEEDGVWARCSVGLQGIEGVHLVQGVDICQCPLFHYYRTHCAGVFCLCVLLFLPLCRQQLIAPGQVADCIYLISHGELEIFSRACPAGSDLSLSEPLISGLDMAQLQEQADADVWDSTPVSDISKEHGGG